MHNIAAVTMPLGFCQTESYAPPKARSAARRGILRDTSHGRYHSFAVQS
ncbi:hypothetical protein [Photorhabdus luminescens]|nr:hypothetical protein [Photorhabdus luminescens]